MSGQREVLQIEIDGSGSVAGKKVVVQSLDEIKQKAGDAGHGFSRMESLVGGVTSRIGALISGAGIALLLRSIVREASEAAASMARLDAVLAATGGRAGVSGDRLRDLASEIQRTTAFGDEAVMDAESTLLRFSRVQGEVFERALRASVDIAAATGRGISEVAQGIGRALEIPGEGMRTLAQAGVVLTDADQKAIDKMLQLGETAEAQALLLDRVEVSTKGAAAAMRDTMGGSLTALKNSWGDLLEQLGSGDAGNALRSTVESVNSFVRGILGNWDALLAGVYTTIASVNGGVARMLEIGAKLPGVFGRSFAAGAQEARDLQAGLLDKANEALDRNVAASDKAAASTGRFTGMIVGEADAVKALRQKILEATTAAAAEALQEQSKSRAMSLGADAARKLAVATAERIAADKFGLDVTNKQIKALLDWTAAAVIYKQNQELLAEGTKKVADAQQRLLERQKAVSDARDRERQAAAQTLIQLKQEFEMARRLAGVRASGGSERDVAIESQYLSFLRQVGQGSIDEGARIMAAYEAMLGQFAPIFGATVEQVRAMIASLVDEAARAQYRGMGTSDLEAKRRHTAELERLSRADHKNAEDYAAAKTQAEQEFLDRQLSNWTGALDFLANRFGGFFKKLAELAHGLQDAIAFGKQVQGAASGMGASASGAAAMGGVATVIAIFAVIYDFVSKMIEKARLVRYGNEASYTLVGGQEGITQLDANGERTVEAIRDLVREINAALGVAITDLAQIGVQIRNDGRRVMSYVNGELVGVFGSLDEAIREAMRVALTSANTAIRGMTDLMRQGLEGWTSPNFDELMRFLGQLREIGNLNAPQGVLDIRSLALHLDELREVLQRMPRATQAVIDGLAALNAAEINAYRNEIDRLTGRHRTAAEELALRQADGRMVQAEMALRIADLKLRALQIQMMMEEMRIRAGQYGGHGRPGGPPGSGLVPGEPTPPTPGTPTRPNVDRGKSASEVLIRIWQIELEAQGTYVNGKASLLKSEVNLYEQQLEVYQLNLDAINALIAELLQLQSEFKLEDIKMPRVGRGGQSRADRLRDQADLREQAAMFGASDVKQQLYDAAHSLDDYIERVRKAGLSAAETARLVAAATAEERRRQDVIAAGIKRDADAFVARGQSPATADLAGQFAGIDQEAGNLIGGLRALRQAHKITTAELIRRMADITAAADAMKDAIAYQTFLDLAQRMAEAAGNQKAALKIEELRWALEKANMLVQIEFLRASGRISAENMALLDQLWEGVRDLALPVSGGAGDGGETPESQNYAAYLAAQEAAAQAAEDAAKRYADAMKRLQAYEDRGLDPLIKSVRDLNADFADLRSILGDTARVQAAYATALQAIIDDALRPLRDLGRELALSEFSPLRQEQRYAEAQAQQAQALAKLRAGDLTQIGQMPALIQALLREGQASLPTGSEAYRTLYASQQALIQQLQVEFPQLLGLFAGGGTPVPGVAPGAAAATGAATAAPIVAQLQDSTSAQIFHLQQIKFGLDANGFTLQQIKHAIEEGNSLLQQVA